MDERTATDHARIAPFMNANAAPPDLVSSAGITLFMDERAATDHTSSANAAPDIVSSNGFPSFMDDDAAAEEGAPDLVNSLKFLP